MLYKLLRYTAQALAIYLIFRYLPTITNSDMGANLSNIDILMITAIIMLIYILFENLCAIYAEPEKVDCNACSTVCKPPMMEQEREHMAIVNPPPQQVQQPQQCNIPQQQSQQSQQLQQSTLNSRAADIANRYGIGPDKRVVELPTYNGYDDLAVIPTDYVVADEVQTGSQEPINTQSISVPNRQEKVFVVRNDSEQRSRIERELEQKYAELYALNQKSGFKLDLPQIERAGSRAQDGIVTDDMSYDTDYNHLPMATGYDSRDYEYGYSFLPPEKWYPTPPFPPVCIQEKQCPVCPMNTSGSPVDMKEWNNSIKILQPDNINTRFIKKLNAGR
jgi:hypothetical protein